MSASELAFRGAFSEGALKDAQDLAQLAKKMVMAEKHEQRLGGGKGPGKHQQREEKGETRAREKR